MKKPTNPNLLSEIQFLTLLISSLLILVVQLVSLLVIFQFMYLDIDNKAEISANEMTVIFEEPLYNVDDRQTIRIAEALLSAGRINGISIMSTASGLVFEQLPENGKSVIKPRTKELYFNNIFLGTVKIYFSDSDLFYVVQRFLLLMALVILTFLVAFILVSRLLVQKRINRTFKVLTKGINILAGGDYDHIIPSTRYRDIDSIIDLINDMAGKISLNNKNLIEINTRLEIHVNERTKELQESLEALRHMQDKLIESGKLSVLGQLAAGIAHEINTPLGAISSSARVISDYLDKSRPHHEHLGSIDLTKKETQLFGAVVEMGHNVSNFETVFPDRRRIAALKKRLEEKGIPNAGDAADMLVELGLGSDEQLDRLFPLLKTERNMTVLSDASRPVIAKRLINVINQSAIKAANVISALRSYLTPGEVDKQSERINIASCLNEVLMLMQNTIKQGIKLNTEISEIYTTGSIDGLSQICINIIRNAAEAMNFRGEIKIRTYAEGKNAVISISDDGPGIPEDIHKKIFDPFFTTKKTEGGMGLGLDICKRIVEIWHGSLTFTSVPGKTEFLIRLPLAPET
ncbi:MAG: hypothetical protein JW874_04395 [Spirochaetales bacterium]|nr:hypothetical protein [Spirochaetales bacterium]